MRWHELKTDPAVFDAVADGSKTHEIRFNDRDFKVGDGLLLRRTRDTGWAMKNTGAPLEFTGQEFRAVVTHVLDGYGLMPGWVILSIKPYGVQPCRLPQQLEALIEEAVDAFAEGNTLGDRLPNAMAALRDALADGVSDTQHQTFPHQPPMPQKDRP